MSLPDKQLRRAIVTCPIALVFAVMVLCWTMAGCAARVKNVTDLPPGVTQKQAQDWDAAVADLHKIALTVSSVRQAVIAARNAGGFPADDAYAMTLQQLGRIDQFELAADKALQQSPQNFGLTTKNQVAGYTQQISVEIDQMNSSGVIGIKNPDSQQQVSNLIKELTGIVKLVLALTRS